MAKGKPIISQFLPHTIAAYLPDSTVHGAHIGPTWGRQVPGGPHVGPSNLVIWAVT